jgi:sortase A
MVSPARINRAAAQFPPVLLRREREGGAPHALGPGTIPLPTTLVSPPPVSWGFYPSPAPSSRAAARGEEAPNSWLDWGTLRRVIAILAALLGIVLLGQGLWIHAKALLAQVLLERAFAATIASGGPVKPWSWADTWPVARIAVPRLGKSAIALAGSSGQALAFGPGHVELTVEPGERGTALYAAHRDTHFAFLADVRIGEAIVVTRRDGVVVRFVVTATSVVRWDQSGIDPLGAGRHLVLSTCWPFDARTAGPLRYLVHAEMAE